jgi:hypothetical protein
VSVAVFGTTDRGRFLENVQAASRSLPEEIISKIEAA